jgi:hypothetical protein
MAMRGKVWRGELGQLKRENKMTKYVYLESVKHAPVDAQVVGEELTRIAKRGGGLKNQVIVDESRPENSPLHAHFEWDDCIAAEAHRRKQASNLIAFIRVVKGEDAEGEPILERPFIHITAADPFQQSTYYTTAKVLSHPELRQAAIADAIAFLSRARGKLAEFKELEKQYLALEKVENDLVETQMKIVRRERAAETTRALVAV